MTSVQHLSEEERHEFADGSLSAERRAPAGEHVEVCDACKNDVARLERLVTEARGAVSPTASDDALDEVWRGVRAGIEQRKVASLSAADATSRPAKTHAVRRRWFVALAAASVAVVSAVVRRGVTKGEDVALAPGPSLTVVAESTQVYENEVQTLLNQLELRRALLRPETAASIDENLRVIDQAIAELREALVRDPNNPSLRQLLASSYRQKVDLLKRVENAG